MLLIVAILSSVVFLFIISKKREALVDYSYDLSSVNTRLKNLKDSNKRYSSKDSIIGDIIKILNCKGEYNFELVNLETSSPGVMLVTLYDKNKAFTSAIEFSTRLMVVRNTGKDSVYYYNIDKLGLLNNDMSDDKNFYNPDLIFSAPW